MTEILNEAGHAKTYKMTCGAMKDPAQSCQTPKRISHLGLKGYHLSSERLHSTDCLDCQT